MLVNNTQNSHCQWFESIETTEEVENHLKYGKEKTVIEMKERFEGDWTKVIFIWQNLVSTGWGYSTHYQSSHSGFKIKILWSSYRSVRCVLAANSEQRPNFKLFFLMEASKGKRVFNTCSWLINFKKTKYRQKLVKLEKNRCRKFMKMQSHISPICIGNDSHHLPNVILK